MRRISSNTFHYCDSVARDPSGVLFKMTSENQKVVSYISSSGCYERIFPSNLHRCVQAGALLLIDSGLKQACLGLSSGWLRLASWNTRFRPDEIMNHKFWAIELIQHAWAHLIQMWKLLYPGIYISSISLALPVLGMGKQGCISLLPKINDIQQWYQVKLWSGMIQRW